MGQKNNAKKSGVGGFLRNLVLCRPRRPKDTGACIQRGSNNKAAVSEKKKTRKFPFLPPPPPDELTPITSNRKSFDNGDPAVSNVETPISDSNHLQEIVTPKSSSADFIDELEASVVKASTKGRKSAANEAHVKEEKVGRKSYPSFHNTHPVQENVKAKLEWFEHAFSSPQSQTPEDTTEDSTETSTDDVRLIRQVPSCGDEPVVDCENDPYERGYAVWYRKGLLKWRPKSVMEEEARAAANAAVLSTPEVDASATTATALFREATLEKNDHDNQVHSRVELSESEATKDDASATTTKDCIGLMGVEISVFPLSAEKSSISVPPEKALHDQEADDAATLLFKYRNKVEKTCAACGKDTSFIIKQVRCMHCKEELYCSIFCRGNDRYKHAVSCSALDGQMNNNKNDRSGSETDQKVHDVSTIRQEEKEESLNKAAVSNVKLTTTEQETSKSPDAGAHLARNDLDDAALDHVTENVDIKDVVEPMDEAVEGINDVKDVFEPMDESVEGNRDTMLTGAFPLPELKVVSGAPPVPVPSTPKTTLHSDFHYDFLSRSNSLRKSKQVPIVTLFGADNGHCEQKAWFVTQNAMASPGRFYAESV